MGPAGERSDGADHVDCRPGMVPAFNRFGLGARPGAVRGRAIRARRCSTNSLPPEAARLERADLKGTAKILQAVFDDDFRRNQERDRLEAMRLATLGMPAPNVAAALSRAVGGHGRRRRRRDDERAARPSSNSFAPTHRRASSRPAPRRSASSSGWSRSGPTISASLSAKSDDRPRRRRRLRARGNPSLCARPLRRHAARRRAASGHAEFSRQRAVDRPQFARRPQKPQPA